MAANDESANVVETPKDPVLADLVEKKVTCPFLGSAVATGKLKVLNGPGDPLASVQEVVDLGNKWGGDLGKVLRLFARGNHGMRRGTTGKLDRPVDPGLFSLELPGSQGSHSGHSGILQGDPRQLESGRFSPEDFERLLAFEHGGFIRRSDFARFIADNFHLDPSSQSLPIATWAREVIDLGKAGFELLDKRNQDEAVDEILQSVTKILGANNLLGSAGEFGLLLAFLHNSPKTRLDRDPAFSVEDITAMFKDKVLPDQPNPWKKSALDWVRHTLSLASGAVAELIKMDSKIVAGLVQKGGALVDLIKMAF